MRIPTLPAPVGIGLVSGLVLVALSIDPAVMRARTTIIESDTNLTRLVSEPIQDAATKRARYITINFDGLPRPLAQELLPGAGATAAERRNVLRQPDMPLDLFPDVAMRAVFDHYDPNSTGVTWVGHVADVPMSTVTLVYADGLMTGSIVTPGASYSIRPAPLEVRLANPQPNRELHVVAEVDQSGLPREAPPIEVVPTAAERAADAAHASDAQADTADTIDLMVLYTPTVLVTSGGLSGITNLINLGVSETNTSYANSGITQRIRLVHTAQVDYTETGAFSTSLNNLRSGTGALAGVAALRDAKRADLVMLLVRPQSPDACGIAFVMSSVGASFATSGFNVVDSSCITNYTFAHELGHNMGARHDWYVDSSTTPFTFAHGYVNPTPGQRWRTIMAYNDLCTDQGFSCSRVLYWASPTTPYAPYCGRGFNCAQLQYWFFPGAMMGVRAGTSTSCVAGVTTNTNCDADDARTLNATALTVANFRTALVADKR